MIILNLSLKDNIDCGYLCKRLQDELNRHLSSHQVDNKVLTIYLNDIIDSNTTTSIKTIESK